MVKISIPCISLEKKRDVDKDRITLNADYYAIEEEYKVANYDEVNVKKEYEDIFHTTSVAKHGLIFSAFKEWKYGIFGVTWKPVVFFLVVYWTFQILYQCNVFRSKSPECEKGDLTQIEPEEEAAKCNRAWHDWVADMKVHENVATRYLTFILGFYVGQMIKRWWDQVKSLPNIDNITNCMAGFIQLEFHDKEVDEEGNEKVREAALDLRKKIARYCLLSWTLCLSSLSRPLGSKFNDEEPYLQKGLITDSEMKIIKVWVKSYRPVSLLFNCKIKGRKGCMLEGSVVDSFDLGNFTHQC